jgi:uncharacterized RDD family membrane protein YckC
LNTSNPLQKELVTGQPAGFFSRLEAFILDLFVILIASLGTVWMAGLILGFFIRPFFDVNIRPILYLPVVVSITIVFYFLFFWSLLGYTPGKFLLGLKIVRRDGSKLGLGRAIVRFIGYWISALVVFLGFIWIIFDPHRQGWHDKLAGTQVIYTWEKPKRLIEPKQG